MHLDPPIDAQLRLPPRRHGAVRRGAVRFAERAASWCGGRGLYRRANLSRAQLHVRRERLFVRDLPEGLEGFRAVHLSDLHAGAFLRQGDLADVVAAANALEPDLAVLTGDLITHHWSEALLVLPDLARLRARHGVLAVFGNHDYKGREEGRIEAAYAEHGIRFLRNRCARIDTGRGALAVVGLEDLEESRLLDLEAARALVREGDFELALCHNPRGALRLAHARCVAVLSGHTHGGQVDLPFLRRAGPPHPGARIRIGATTLIVNRGLGAIGLPWRVGAPAEIVLIELARQSSEQRGA